LIHVRNGVTAQRFSIKSGTKGDAEVVGHKLSQAWLKGGFASNPMVSSRAKQGG